MKPRSKPGKSGTASRSARVVIAKAKPLSMSQVRHLQSKQIVDASAPKAGRKGKRAHWNIDYEEGVEYDKKVMPCREPETFTISGTRRWGKRGH